MYRSLDIPCTNVDTSISGLTAAILYFWVISAFVTIEKDLLKFTQHKTWLTTLFYLAISVYQGCLLRATILFILDEFHQSKLLLWRHAYWGHVMLRPWNWCCPVDNLFVHNIINKFCHISSDKKVTQQRVLWGYFPPICNTRVNISRSVYSVVYFTQLFSGEGGWVAAYKW